MSLQWSREKKDDSDLNEKELNIINNKSEKVDHKHSVSDEKSKECESEVFEVFDFEDYFQIEVVDVESRFVCNICNEGLENEQEFKEHIKNYHESRLNDDSYDDINLYEGFDKEGHIIV